MADSDTRIGILRGRENSFPDAFIEKVNGMDKGVAAEYVQLGGTKLNEHGPERVIGDRMSHEVPYYEVYLKMVALQGTYCINNTFWRSADDKFFGYAAAEKMGIASPRTVVLPNKSYVEDVTGDSLRNLWPVDFAGLLDYAGDASLDLAPRLIAQIPDEMRIRGLRDKISAIFRDQRFQKKSHAACLDAAAADSLELLRKLYHLQRRGVRITRPTLNHQGVIDVRPPDKFAF